MTSESPAVAAPAPEARKTPADAATAAAKNKLTLERANSIGWFFVESYYELYNQNPENLYKLYSSSASVAHAELPEASVTVRTAAGTEAIKALFKDIKSDGKKNKIIITAADIQLCLGANILIGVSGEWSKNGSPYYQFSQTFVLCPGINEATFDIANDILRFIDYEFKRREATRAPEPVSAPETPAEAKEAAPEPEKEVKEPAEAEPQPVVQDAAKDAAKEAVQEAAKEAVQEAADEAADEPAPKEEKAKTAEKEEPAAEDDKPEEPAPVASGNISWAALAATASEKSPVPKAAPPAPKVVAAKKAPAPTASLPNGKFKREDWFPIYIRGCEELEEKTLKEHLSKEFGEIKFFKQNNNIALCDFVDGDGQRKALDAKKFTLDGTTVSLEVRESKLGKKDGKDFKQFKDKNGNDAKRRNEKKQAAKKNKS